MMFFIYRIALLRATPWHENWHRQLASKFLTLLKMVIKHKQFKFLLFAEATYRYRFCDSEGRRKNAFKSLKGGRDVSCPSNLRDRFNLKHDTRTVVYVLYFQTDSSTISALPRDGQQETPVVTAQVNCCAWQR